MRRRAAMAATLLIALAAALPAQPPAGPMTLDQLVQLGIARHPKLQQAAFAVDAARGRAVHAGLYPNPQLQIYGDELGDKTGPSGIWTAPSVTQEIVRGKKLSLSKAAACREVDQATWALVTQRAALMTAIRQATFDVLALLRRIEIQAGLVRLADQSVEQAGKLFTAKLIARLEVLQLEVDRERYRADHESALRELPGAIRRLAAIVGVAELPGATLGDVLELPLPDYDLDKLRPLVASVSPELQSATIGIDKARLLLARAQAEPIPNVTLGANFVRQGQNRSNDWGVSLAMPIPAWNRNQGNIKSAQAAYRDAVQEVARVEVDLVDRLASAHRDFASAQVKAERYRTLVLPKAKELGELSRKAYQSGQLEFLKQLESQRAVETAELDYLKARADAWRAAATIAGLTLEEPWPPIKTAP